MIRSTESRKYKLGALVLVSLLVGVCGSSQAQGFIFADPAQLYSSMIPDGWVFQAHYSTPQLTVFYGEDDFDLLYFESLGETDYWSVRELAERSLELYASPGGLDEFRLEKPLQPVDVAGQWGLSCSYSYVDDQGKQLSEYKVFFLLPGREGFSISLSSNRPSIMDGSILGSILEHWRWSF